ncbi:MucBP domain-containing protein, partial [Streptococcus suis]|uniref:MucBP domain-containing protein n=3 Tax=Streptococcus suis TaxID=1307 RepID=UPI0038BAF984
MHHSRRKSFDWYGLKQHFSIRKYHFGAASVLLGMSIALGTGTQVVQAAETVTTPESTSVASSTSATESTTSETSTETATSSSSERTVEIGYIVKYATEDGTLVNASVETVSVTTTETIAKATVSVTAVVPEGYELASGQSATVSQEVTENGVNIVTVKVVKKAEEKAATSETTTTASTETATAKSTEGAATTTATVSEAVKTPATVEEAKTVLEQVTSEAEVLANESERLVAASDKEDTALKAAAAATKLTATQATAVLKDSVATLEEVNAQISAVRTNVEALVLELRKYLGTDVIEIALNTSLTSGLKVGEGEGILVEKGTTATPSMDNANGAGIKPHTLRTGITATTEPGWYTFDSYDLYSYNENMKGTIFKGTEVNAYMRFSLDSDPNTNTILAELVSKTGGQVLERHTIDSDTSALFTYPKTIDTDNENILMRYETKTAVDGSTYGTLIFNGDGTGTIYNTTIIPVYQINTTTYKVEDGRILALYNLQTIAGQTVTSSGQREFEGYEFVEKLVEPAQGGYPVGSKYVAGRVNTATDKTNTLQYKVIRTIVSNTEYVHEIYVLDPTYTGPVDWDGLDTRGFFKLLETSSLSYTPDRVSYDYNTNATIEANYTVDPETGFMVFAESPLNDRGSKYRVVAQWSGNDTTGGRYGRIYIASQVWTKANTGVDTPYGWQMYGGTFVNLGYAPFGIQQTLRGASTPAALTTTYVYRALEQEAIIRYQVEGATDYLEDSGILTGGSGTDINYSTEETINKYKKLGYELVSDNFTTTDGQDYDTDTAVLQEFLVVIKPRVVDVPKGVVPGEPVDPTDPNSPVWPDTVKNQETTQAVTRTVEYKYEDGTPVRIDASGNILPKDSTEGTPLVKTQTVTFTRPAQVNLVTGEITYGEWSADSTDVLSGNLIPEITDYTATRTTLEGADAPMTETVKDKTVAATDADINEVVYFKENPKYGDVVVNYVNTDGKVIATPVVDTNDALVGTDYSTADRVPEKIVEDTTGDVYYYKEIKAEDAAKETGKVVEGTTEVTYIYEKAGSVNVNYVDTEGNVLKDPVADVTDGKPGSGYDTVLDNKLASISVDGKLYRLVPAGTYNVGTVSDDNNLTAAGNGKATGIDATTGTVEAGKTKEITYVYEEVKGDVVVEYYDTEGNQIAKTVVDEEDKSVGTVYNTDEDNKPETITTEDGTVYYYKEVKDTSAPTTGKVAETTTTVQYVYEKAGSVNVNYVDTEGNPIQAPVADETNEKAGTEYATADNKPSTITTEDGKTYRLVEAGTYNVGTVSDDNNLTAVGNGKATGIDATTGTVEAGTTKEITYVYEEVKGNVVVNYITTDGTVIKQPVEDTPSTSTGTPYDTKDNKPTTITTEDGKTYRIVPVLTKGSETGKVVEGTTSITYVYEEVKGDVVVEYYDTEGNLISGLSDSGEAVDTKEVDTPSTSTGTAYNTDEDHKPNTITTADGTVYYYKEVKDTSASTTGKVVEGTTTVQYVYEKAGNVIVHYITEDGTVIKATVTDETNVPAGKSYDTTDNKPTEIVTEDGSRYVLIPSKTIGSENGKVEGGKTTEITYVYKKVANWIPEIPGVPENERPVIPYPFDPNTPDVPVTPTPGTVIPNVPGYTPVDPKDNTPLKPVDPNDPGKGYVPPTPEKTGEDTLIPYVQNGNVVVNYVTEDGTVIKSPVKDETDAPAGKSYDTTDNKPTEIVTEDGSRYVLIPSKTIGSENGTVEGGKTTEITYVYKKVANWIPEIPGVPENERPVIPYPFDPNTPDVPVTPTPGTVIPNVPGYTPVDPKDNTPLKPVDPNDPDKGYVPPTPENPGEDTLIPYVQNGNVVVNYVTEDGTVIKTPVNDETDAPAGKSYDTTDNKPVEIVTEDGSRYVLIPSKTIGTENGTVEGGKTIEITYVYKKVANWIPQIPGVPAGEEPKVPYPFDPTNPDVPVTPTPDTVIPNVPGYTPVDPKTNEPLKPVDPNDPGKGYVPSTPDETGKDTPIPYVQNGNVVVNYVTEDGTVIKAPVQDETNVPAGKSYDTTDNKPTEIVTEDGSRYVLIPSKTIGSETGTVEGGKTTEITYVYKKVANWIPQIPGVPAGEEPKVPYPFDPTNPDKPIDPTTPGTNGEVPSIPHVPGYTPVDPKTNEPLKPVDPTDPSKGYVPPTPDETGVDTPIPYVQNGNVVVNYVDENGNVLKTPVNDETDAPAGKSYDTTDNKPVEIVTEDGSRYVLVPSKTVGSETGAVVGGKTIEITYVYKKVANWIPQIPGVPEGQEPKVPYPFAPTNPDKPIDPTTPYPDGEVPSIPNVPGYTPVDPKTNEPLKPVDPNDPGKGYVPSTPDETGKDTPIPYVQNGNVVVNYVTEDGTVIKAPVQDETNVPAGKSYDTTDNKPNTITTEDGTTYELVRVEGSETGTVEGGKTTEVTYVYRKVETPAKKVVTNHVDEDGNPIAPQEEGTTPNKSIPGYEF